MSLIDRGAALAPASDATNLYDLCEDACECMLREHARYDQGIFGATLETHPSLFRDIVRVPACGTIGCRAGWLVHLADGGFPKAYDPYHIGSIISSRADELMGVMEVHAFDMDFERYLLDVEGLFSANALLNETGHDMEEEPFPEPGTKEYAELGVKGLRAFMAKWEARLRATPVVRKEAA